MFDESKNRQVVTYITVDPCFVTQIRTKEKDGYTAVQVGVQTRSAKNIGKTLKGQAKKAGVTTPLSFFKEIRLNEEEIKNFTLGQALLPDKLFAVKEKVLVTGTTKGKGFQGVVRRHHFKGGPKTHGQSDRQRAPGAIGSGTTPGRIWKGKRMAGKMGNETQTIKGLEIVKADSNSLLLKGLVPGRIGNVILIKTLK